MLALGGDLPLVADLDRALLGTGALYEPCQELLRISPPTGLSLPALLFRQRPPMQRHIAQLGPKGLA